MAKKLNRVFDRKVEFDDRSKNFRIMSAIPPKLTPRSYTWSVKSWLDQGQEGACVGFGWSHFLAGRPKPEPNITAGSAEALYMLAKTLDQWPGTDYDGTSVIAGAKAVKLASYIQEYRWAFGAEEAILAVGHAAPVVLGINWYEGMDNPDSKGLVKVTGSVRGGHCILMNGVNVKKQLVRLHNSWGKDWGLNGEVFVSFDDLAKLLEDDGEACIPLLKKLLPETK